MKTASNTLGPPRVLSADSGYYDDATLSTPLGGPVKASTDIYVKVAFSEDVGHVVSNLAAARPEISYQIAQGSAVRFHVVAPGTTLASGDCRPDHATSRDVYECRYTTASSDSGDFDFIVGTGTQDSGGTALAAAYTHATKIAVDTTAPTVTAASSGYYTTSSFTTPLAGPVNADTAVYVKFAFSEDVKHATGTDTIARPLLWYQIGAATPQQFEIVSDTTTLTSGDCRPDHATDRDTYECLYSVLAADSGDFELLVNALTEDVAGNALAADYRHATELPVDNTAPTFVSATVSGSTLTLTFSENLDTSAGARADKSAFAVTVAGSSRAVSSYALSGKTATLTLASAVTAGQNLTVAYTRPGGTNAKLADLAGNELANFSETLDLSAPTVTSASSGYFADAGISTPLTGPVKAGANIYVKVAFSQNVEHTAGTGASARPELSYSIADATPVRFHIVADGATLQSGECRPDAATPADVYECRYQPLSTDSGNFDFRVGTGTRNIAKQALAAAYTHADKIAIDNTAPTLSSVRVNGSTLTVTFSENMDSSAGAKAANSAWDVQVTPSGGSAARRNVSSYTVSGSTATLTLASAAVLSDTVTVAYDQPSGTASKLADLAGNLLATTADGSELTAANNTGAPTVTAASSGYFSDAGLSTPLTGPVKADTDIHVKVTFSENVGHTEGDGASARPEIRFKIGKAAERQFHIVASTATLRSGDCQPDAANPADVYECVYRATAGDNGPFDFRVGTGTQDSGGTALAAAYIHAAKVQIDNESPRVVAASTGYYEDASAAKKLTGTVKGGSDIYTLVTFSENVTHVPSTDAPGRPELSWRKGGTGGTVSAYDIIAANATLSNGQCKPRAATPTTAYLCLYTVAGSDSGAFDLLVGTATTDVVGNALAEMFRPSASLILEPAPVFTATIADQTWQLNQAISALTLPAASGGDAGAAITYSLSPTLPDGLVYTSATRMITGTPTAFSAATTYTYTATETDGDSASLTFSAGVSGKTVLPSASSVTVAEGGSATFTARLGAQPSGDVTVSVTRTGGSADVTVDTDANTAGNQSDLTFTTLNWNTAQTVTVSAADDADAVQDTAVLTLDPSGADYASAPSATVQVQVTEDEADTTAPTLSFAPADAALTNKKSADITLTFAETVYSDASGTAFDASTAADLITLRRNNAFGAAIDFSAAVTTTGANANKVITIDPSADLADGKVYVAVGAGFYDAAGNQGSAASVTFTVDATPPTVVAAKSGYYSDLAATTAVTKSTGGQTIYYKITFSEKVKFVEATNASARPDIYPENTVGFGNTLDWHRQAWITSPTDSNLTRPECRPGGPSPTEEFICVYTVAAQDEISFRFRVREVEDAAGNVNYKTTNYAHPPLLGPQSATITVSPATRTVEEGDDTNKSATFSVSGSALPFGKSDADGFADFTITSGDTGAVTVSPTTLRLGKNDYNNKSFTVTAVDDDDGQDEIVTIRLINAGTSDGDPSYAHATASVRVSVDDDETDSTAPTVDAAKSGYFSDAAATVALAGPVRDGDIYTRITFSERVKHTKGTGSTARPQLSYRLGSGGTVTQYEIEDATATLASGECKPAETPPANAYICLYSVGATDNGDLDFRVGTNTVDNSDSANALAAAYTHTTTLEVDTTAPTVTAAYYSDSAASQSLTGTVKGGNYIYTKVTFSEDMAHVAGSDASARPAIGYKKAGGTATPFAIIANTATLANGQCQPDAAPPADIYLCRYRVLGSDTGTFDIEVGTASTDRAGNALASAYSPSASLTLDPAPLFADGVSIADQVYAAGTPITTLNLPRATGGKAPLTYALTPALPTGLSFSARTLTGTPSARSAEATYTYTVTDADGDSSSLTFKIEVTEKKVLAPATLTVAEGSSASFSVSLGGAPNNNVTVTIASDNSDVTVDTDSVQTGNQNDADLHHRQLEHRADRGGERGPGRRRRERDGDPDARPVGRRLHDRRQRHGDRERHRRRHRFDRADGGCGQERLLRRRQLHRRAVRHGHARRRHLLPGDLQRAGQARRGHRFRRPSGAQLPALRHGHAVQDRRPQATLATGECKPAAATPASAYLCYYTVGSTDSGTFDFEVGTATQDASDAGVALAAKYTHQTQLTIDATPPTVDSANSGYFDDVSADADDALTGPVKAGAVVYTKIVFSENVRHKAGTGSNGRPALSHGIAGVATRYAIVADTATLKDGECQPENAAPDDTYLCRYTVVSADNGDFDFRVGTDSEDGARNALASAYTHTTKLTLDNTPPTFSSARVGGSSLTLTFNEALDTASTPAAGDFVVTVGGTGRAVSSVAVSGSTVTLALASAVAGGSTVNVRYTQSTTPGAALLQDVAGNAAASFGNQSVNNAGVSVTFSPANAAVTRAKSANLTITFDGAVYADASQTTFTNASAAGIVTLKSTGATGPAINFSATINAANTVITVNPAADLADGKVYVAVSNAWYDGDGNQGASVNATFTVDTAAPTVSSATVSGSTLTVTFSEDMDTSAGALADNSAFAVTVAGSKRTVNSYTLSGKTATLTLASAVTAGQAVTVAYTKPTGTNAKLADLAGNELENFSRTPDTPAATVTFSPANGARTNANSGNITLTFSKAVYKDASQTEFGASDLSSLIELKVTDDNGSAITFAASINDANTVVTVNPDANLADGDVYVEVGSGFYDAAGNQGASVNATFTVDTAAPTVSSATVSGSALTVTFSEDMDTSDAARADKSAFAVTVAGSGRTVNSYTLSGKTATLTLASAVTVGQSVTVAYTKPTGNNAKPLKDLAGNELANFSRTLESTVPPAPTVSLIATTDRVRITASVSSNGGSAITKWEWRFKGGAFANYSSWVTAPNAVGNSMVHSLDAEAHGHTYTYDVRAVNAVGNGASTEESVIVAGLPHKPPDATFTVTAGNASVTLAATTTDGGASISRWEYRQKAGSGNYGSWQKVSDSAGTTFSTTVTGLTGNTTYAYQVRAVNSFGAGPASAEKSATPVATVPPKPDIGLSSGSERRFSHLRVLEGDGRQPHHELAKALHSHRLQPGLARLDRLQRHECRALWETER